MSHVYAAGNFPIGFSSNGIPVGLLVSGPPGHDSIILNLLNQMDGVFGELAPPPSPALCQGCTSNVTYLGPVSVHHQQLPVHCPTIAADLRSNPGPP